MALHTLTYAQLLREIGRFLAIGEDSTSWGTLRTQKVEDGILRGSRRFYFDGFAMLDPENPVAHSWSFIQDVMSVTLVKDTTRNDLPADFMKLLGVPSLSSATASYQPLERRSADEIRHLSEAHSGFGGTPIYYSIDRENPSSAALLYQVGVYPQPDVAMTLNARYIFDPTVASTSQAPILTSLHAETYIASILSVMDELFNIETTDFRMLERFKALLRVSIANDRMLGGGE